MQRITPLLIAVATMTFVIASMAQRSGHVYQDVTPAFVTPDSGRIFATSSSPVTHLNSNN